MITYSQVPFSPDILDLMAYLSTFTHVALTVIPHFTVTGGSKNHWQAFIFLIFYKQVNPHTNLKNDIKWLKNYLSYPIIHPTLSPLHSHFHYPQNIIKKTNSSKIQITLTSFTKFHFIPSQTRYRTTYRKNLYIIRK